jgi:hypothetical protein
MPRKVSLPTTRSPTLVYGYTLIIAKLMESSLLLLREHQILLVAPVSETRFVIIAVRNRCLLMSIRNPACQLLIIRAQSTNWFCGDLASH